jgi:hypothetical protein
MAATSIGVAIEKLNTNKSPGIDQIPAEVIIKQEVGQFTLRSINFMLFISKH